MQDLCQEPKQDKQTRNTFNKKELKILESLYESQAYPSRTEKYRLSQIIHRSECEVSIWFNNRRAKGRKSGVKPVKCRGATKEKKVRHFSESRIAPVPAPAIHGHGQLNMNNMAETNQQPFQMFQYNGPPTNYNNQNYYPHIYSLNEMNQRPYQMMQYNSSIPAQGVINGEYCMNMNMNMNNMFEMNQPPAQMFQYNNSPPNFNINNQSGYMNGLPEANLPPFRTLQYDSSPSNLDNQNSCLNDSYQTSHQHLQIEYSDDSQSTGSVPVDDASIDSGQPISHSEADEVIVMNGDKNEVEKINDDDDDDDGSTNGGDDYIKRVVELALSKLHLLKTTGGKQNVINIKLNLETTETLSK